MPHIRFGLRTLLIAIAVIGLCLGGYRWWLGRKAMLKMALVHESEANRLTKLISGTQPLLASGAPNSVTRTVGSRLSQFLGNERRKP